MVMMKYYLPNTNVEGTVPVLSGTPPPFYMRDTRPQQEEIEMIPME
jgi:hypothetical protein